jgi:hypothetical protein
MASKAGTSLFITAEPGAQDKKRPKATKKTPKNGKAAPMPALATPAFSQMQQYSEPKPRTQKEQLVDDVQHERRMATRDWVAGRMSDAKHAKVHSRAKQALKGMKMGR